MDMQYQTLTVELPYDLVDFLQSEGRRLNTSAADVLQQAIANHRFLQQKQNEGSSVLLESKDRALSKVELPSS
jgi:hypothetical protein